MYDTMCRDFYCPHVPNDLYVTVRNCQFCARNRCTNKIQRDVRLSQPSDTLEFVAVDIFGPLPKTESGNHYVVVMTDR